MDFYTIRNKKIKDTYYVYPDWKVNRSNDLMVRGRAFYAVWDEERGLWSTDEFDVKRLVDQELYIRAQEFQDETGYEHIPMTLESFNSRSWFEFKRFMTTLPNHYHQLDSTVTFADQPVKRTDYVSRRLPYSLTPGNCDAWEELSGVLYSESELDKIKWAIGSILEGDSKHIQKFLVLYGPAGSGKSTILNIIHMLFPEYTTTFDARALASTSAAFSTEVFRTNPLVAIQHDGDLSKILDNTRLNSIISHEEMMMNEKYKAAYSDRVNALLFIGTNQPVKITDAKSGITRRLIDVIPTGLRVDATRYNMLMHQIRFELAAIAAQCHTRYKEMGPNYYNTYRPVEMMLQTDVFYNFIEAYFDVFKSQDGITLRQAYTLYREFCAETGIDKLLPQYKFREELRNYFDTFSEKTRVDGQQVRSYYSGFRALDMMNPFKPGEEYKIELFDQESSFDRLYPYLPAQYGKESGYPGRKWINVTTHLADIDTRQLHFVKVPENYIVLDFDLTDENGEKSLEINLEAASKLPPTYTELSQSGKGVHLHYIYSGDVHELSSVFDVGIEIKTLLGDSSLRRRLTKCNNLDPITISGGLPKKEKSVIDNRIIKSERGLRELVGRNIRKEIHPGTKPSIDFIAHILQEAYDSGMAYDLRDMRPDVLTFAAKSTNHSSECVREVQRMMFVGKHNMQETPDDEEKPIVFFDVEVFPNLFVLCWKAEGSEQIVRMINPTPVEIEPVLSMKLVGFNNRRYDNHILYGRYLGYSELELFHLSQKIINQGNDRNDAMFGEAYNISYADIYDFSSKKQGLKKFMIELGLRHYELDMPWEEPVPEGQWTKVEDYCANDVLATEAVFNARRQDFVARQILAELSGLSVNHTTQSHTAKIIFGDDREPQKKFVYTDLAGEFPGYTFDGRESWYKGETPGEGGYVYAEVGAYVDTTVLDVASMHPTSIEVLNLFGPYTAMFSALKEARMAIKHKNYELARVLLDGKLEPFLDDDSHAEDLAYALKIVINIVYGLTSARFPNAFRDNRNKDNIVAKRGALFMIDLKHAVQDLGFTVAHIKTDSIKIPNATPEIIDFVIGFGAKYGYIFEHEADYERFCLVNDAVYIARKEGKWHAVGAQFQHPYVFKTLFSREELVFDDFCETKNVTQGTMYIDKIGTDDTSEMQHVGRTGAFVPVRSEGGILWRIKEGNKYHVSGTKNYMWVDREFARNLYDLGELHVDMDYFETLVQKAREAIEQFIPFEEFIS